MLCSCSKSNDGIDGADGSKILSGVGAPASTLGVVGDYYLDTAAKFLYGPKTAAGWNTAISLQGEPGADGSKILSGVGAPASSLGVVGDYYLDTAAKNLYGPKTVAGWGSPTNLQGAAGNAEVRLYNFGPRTFIYNQEYIIPLGSAITQNCLIYAYYNPSVSSGNNIWYLVPGPGPGSPSAYEVRSFYSYGTSTYISVQLINSSGTALTTNVTWNGFKIIVIPVPAGNIIQLSSAKPNIDFNNYTEVAAYYNLLD